MFEGISTAEHARLQAAAERQSHSNWQRWGPYLSERQWGTVREDYSPDGTCWDYFTHDQARSRAYRWGEDGLLGMTDRECRMCFGLALWNGHDAILKERLYGLSGPEGNHGEDVKECYYYLDATPTSSYLKGLYKYPQGAFPYDRLRDENRSRGKNASEFELADTGAFDEHKYFDVQVEYAKDTPNNLLIRITISNRGEEAAPLHVLPTLWYRNTWSWGCTHEGCWAKPRIFQRGQETALVCEHASLGHYRFAADTSSDGVSPAWLFTENETNFERIFNTQSPGPYRKDAFHEYLIHDQTEAINPENFGTKAAAWYKLEIPAGESITLKLRLWDEHEAALPPFGPVFDETFTLRIEEADDFHAARHPDCLTPDEKQVLRQAEAGLLWSKQFYHYIVEDWLAGDPEQPPVPSSRRHGRNSDWKHLFNRDIISMPDKWEYPWYAAWDLAFHMIPFARLDPNFAKDQLLLFLREWYMHPNGQIPAYEFAFGDVNPPVHAWACWRVYKMTAPRGKRDLHFLERTFHKLLLNFTWWVNRKDPDGMNLFSGGFLGLDNIGVFDRSKPLPTGGHLEQADGTAWMAFYCMNMLTMALELAHANPAYEDVASKFFEHYVAIIHAINAFDGTGLWDEEDGFYYDHLHLGDRKIPLKIRSLVGVIPLFAVGVLDDRWLERMPGFRKRMHWFLENRPELAQHITHRSHFEIDGNNFKRMLLAIPTRERLARVLKPLLDEEEFLSPYGIRSLSRVHRQHPYVFYAGGEEHRVEYVPGESNTWLFGGNSNWRGPVWFPINFLLIEALERYHYFYGETFRVECPTGSGRFCNLKQVSEEIAQRLVRLFLSDEQGQRPCHGSDERYAKDPHWRDLLQFHEYFHGDHGQGLGASHQTGWTALVASLLRDIGRDREVAF